MASVSSCDCRADSYLTAEQVGYFRARLHDWRHELCTRMKGASGETMNEGVSDWIDAASINSQVASLMAEQDRCRQLIRQIDAALARIAVAATAIVWRPALRSGSNGYWSCRRRNIPWTLRTISNNAAGGCADRQKHALPSR